MRIFKYLIGLGFFVTALNPVWARHTKAHVELPPPEFMRTTEHFKLYDKVDYKAQIPPQGECDMWTNLEIDYYNHGGQPKATLTYRSDFCFRLMTPKPQSEMAFPNPNGPINPRVRTFSLNKTRDPGTGVFQYTGFNIDRSQYITILDSRNSNSGVFVSPIYVIVLKQGVFRGLLPDYLYGDELYKMQSETPKKQTSLLIPPGAESLSFISTTDIRIKDISINYLCPGGERNCLRPLHLGNDNLTALTSNVAALAENRTLVLPVPKYQFDLTFSLANCEAMGPVTWTYIPGNNTVRVSAAKFNLKGNPEFCSQEIFSSQTRRFVIDVYNNIAPTVEWNHDLAERVGTTFNPRPTPVPCIGCR